MADRVNVTIVPGWFCGALGLLFIGIKLSGSIDWSWWLVLLPLYLPLAFVVVALCAIGVVWLAATAGLFALWLAGK